jgi:hypothetical protein
MVFARMMGFFTSLKMTVKHSLLTSEVNKLNSKQNAIGDTYGIKAGFPLSRE